MPWSRGSRPLCATSRRANGSPLGDPRVHPCGRPPADFRRRKPSASIDPAVFKVLMRWATAELPKDLDCAGGAARGARGTLAWTKRPATRGTLRTLSRTNRRTARGAQRTRAQYLKARTAEQVALPRASTRCIFRGTIPGRPWPTASACPSLRPKAFRSLLTGEQ